MDSDHQKIVADVYSYGAEQYSSLWAELLAVHGQRLIEGLDLRGNETVLDLGCGVGQLLPSLRSMTPRGTVFGADRAEGMIRVASVDFPRVVSDAMNLPFGAGSFQAVVMAFVLFHIPDPARALREVHRSLTPGGRIAVGTWAGDTDDFPANRVWSAELDAYGADPEYDASPGRHATNTPAKMTSLIHDAGFERIRVEINNLDDPMTVNEFLERRTTLGFSARRFASLDPTQRRALLATARRRLEELRPQDLISREESILAWGRKPSA